MTALSGPAADAAVRLVQEAITNVRKHSPGANLVAIVKISAEGLTVAVEDYRSGAGSSQPVTSQQLSTTGGGYGIAGIRERAALLGGAAAAGPTSSGWKVELTLPPDALASRS